MNSPMPMFPSSCGEDHFTPSQKFMVWLKAMNPQIPDREMLRLLGLRESDSGLLARVRKGQRDLTVSQIQLVQNFCVKNHGKYVRVRPLYKKKEERLKFVGRPRLGQHLLAKRKAAQKAAASKVKPLGDAVRKLRNALREVRARLSELNERYPDMSFLTKLPGPDGGELEPLPMKTMQGHNGKVREVFDPQAIRAVAVPVFVETGEMLVPLIDEWDMDLVAVDRADTHRAASVTPGALERLWQRVTERERAEAKTKRPKTEIIAHGTDGGKP